MSYMVIFRTPDGKPGYQPAEELPEAVATVERLRNEDGVENVRIFRMQELHFEYKVRYTVELTDPESPEAGAGAGEPAAGPPIEQTDALSWDDDEDGPAAPGQPFDQMAVDHTEEPRWGGGESGEGGEEPKPRRGIFGG